MTAITNDDIARVAYAIWEAEGQPGGRDHEHWMLARQLLEEGRAEVEFPQAFMPEAAEAERAPHSAQPVRRRKNDVPGPRDPSPVPPASAEGFVAIPSLDGAAGGALGDDPIPPRGATGSPG